MANASSAFAKFPFLPSRISVISIFISALEKAKNVLEPIVGDTIEFLPLIHKQKKILCYACFKGVGST
ncbi:hypothetical protein CON82_23215 [Bacillus wiedmannii]|nr:hypothetical protein CON82_23215 [Bacillus wiedmannii]